LFVRDEVESFGIELQTKIIFQPAQPCGYGLQTPIRGSAHRHGEVYSEVLLEVGEEINTLGFAEAQRERPVVPLGF
jgi:hypothetical protein